MTLYRSTSDSAQAGDNDTTPAIFRTLTPGLFLITLGGLLLIIQLDLLSPEQLWKLWPIGLIMAGISELEEWWRDQR